MKITKHINVELKRIQFNEKHYYCFAKLEKLIMIPTDAYKMLFQCRNVCNYVSDISSDLSTSKFLFTEICCT